VACTWLPETVGYGKKSGSWINCWMAPPNRAQLELFFKDKYATYTTKYEEQFTSFPQLQTDFSHVFLPKNNLQ